MNRRLMLAAALLALTLAAPAAFASENKAVAVPAPAAEKAAPRAFFANLKDGDTVTSPVNVKFGVSGMDVAPTGIPDPKPGSGHFHLLIDTSLTPEQMKGPIPKDDTHLHYGKGQTEDSVKLAPGKHTLQLVMGDANHMLHNPPVMSDKITVTVK